jgi:tetratricopeptide (TPR) repeat protein
VEFERETHDNGGKMRMEGLRMQNGIGFFHRGAGLVAAWTLVATTAGAQSPPAPSAAAPGGSAPASGGAAAGDELKALLAQADRLYAYRERRGKVDEARALLNAAPAALARTYEVLWRLARLDCWRASGEDHPDLVQSRFGKACAEAAERAVAADPGRVEGHYYAALGLGAYAVGIGVFKALREGIEGRIRSHLAAADRADRRFFLASVPILWGRFLFKLPWPKRDLAGSERHFKEAFTIDPGSTIGRVFVAELRLEQGNPKEAKRLLDEVLATPARAVDPAGDRRSQHLARALMPKVVEALGN